MNEVKRTVKQKAFEGMMEYLLISFYLGVVLSLFTVYKVVILAEHNIDFAPHGFAIINALALAKIILVAQELHFAEQLRDAPLIYPTLLKSFAFTMLLVLFKVVEHTSVGMFHGKSFYDAIASSGDGSWKGTICLIALPTLFHRLHFDCATGSLFVLEVRRGQVIRWNSRYIRSAVRALANFISPITL